MSLKLCFNISMSQVYLRSFGSSKTTIPIEVGDDSNKNEENERTDTFHRMQKKKEKCKGHDLSMCCLLVRAKMNTRLKMTS
jgi:hypothetical protein